MPVKIPVTINQQCVVYLGDEDNTSMEGRRRRDEREGEEKVFGASDGRCHHR